MMAGNHFDFIGIDSLIAAAAGVDENDTSAALPLKFAAKLTDFTLRYGRPSTVCFLHHSKKDDADDRKMVRGTSAFFADLDWGFRFIDEEENEKEGYRRMFMRCIKPCAGVKPPPVPIELTRAGSLQRFETKDEEDAKAVKATKGGRPADGLEKKKQEVLLAVAAQGSKGFIGTKHLATHLGWSPTEARRITGLLLEEQPLRLWRTREGQVDRWFADNELLDLYAEEIAGR